MAHRTATLNIIPRHLADALQWTLTLTASSAGQRIAQREMAIALEPALDARRQRILISQSQVGNAKWLCLFVQAVCALFAIALVHSDNRLAAATIHDMSVTAGIPGEAIVVSSHLNGQQQSVVHVSRRDFPADNPLTGAVPAARQVAPTPRTQASRIARHVD